MELVKRNEKKGIIIARCEGCGREIEIPYANTMNPRMSSIDLKASVQCECGEYHNLVVDPKEYQSITSPPDRTSAKAEDDMLKCPRCGSTQLHSGDKGFGLGKAVAGGLLIGTAGLLGGFIGHKKIMITCLKCGYKWQAGKR